MHLGGALAEQPRRVEVGADRSHGSLREVGGARLHQAAGQLGWLLGGGRLETLEVVGERGQRVLPGVALVGHVALEDGQGQRLASLTPELEAARNRCDLRKVRVLREEPADLELRVQALLEPARDLEDQALAVNDRVVALLGHG